MKWLEQNRLTENSMPVDKSNCKRKCNDSTSSSCPSLNQSSASKKGKMMQLLTLSVVTSTFVLIMISTTQLYQTQRTSLAAVSVNGHGPMETTGMNGSGVPLLLLVTGAMFLCVFLASSLFICCLM